MSVILTADTISRIPVHDAHMWQVGITSEAEGCLSVRIEMTLHSDESLDDLAPLGIHGRALRLCFQNVWQMSGNLYGVQTRSEAIASWELKHGSELLNRLALSGVGRSEDLTHHHITLSGGSSIDILAEEVSVENLLAHTNQ